MTELLIVFIGLILLWLLTGFYLSSQYQKVIKGVEAFRESIKSHVLENGTTDEKLYQLVIEESRNILPDEHEAVKAHKSANN
jgi:hypothetical protein|tara:strand:- start:2305 stop:2550 length:246 start_codon:yes stop_codon:yes gene_type:complete